MAEARVGTRRCCEMTILIADDDRVQVLLLSKHLMKKGIEVAGAYDAMQAFSTVMKKPFDAVLLDINMPAGTGYEVLRRMRASLRTSLIPVVVISGSIRADEEEKVRALGADGFLKKPVDLEQLDRVLAGLLGAPEAPGQAGMPAGGQVLSQGLPDPGL